MFIQIEAIVRRSKTRVGRIFQDEDFFAACLELRRIRATRH
jgi:hypothetical protein